MTISANDSFMTVITCLVIERWDVKHDAISIISYQLGLSQWLKWYKNDWLQTWSLIHQIYIRTNFKIIWEQNLYMMIYIIYAIVS